MTTLMKHPDHGWTHAYGDGDIKRLEGLGWAVDAPKPARLGTFERASGVGNPVPAEIQFYEAPLVLPVVDAMPDETPAKRKPGRPRKAA